MAKKTQRKGLFDTVADVSFAAVSRRYFVLCSGNVVNDLGLFHNNDYNNARRFRFFVGVFLRADTIHDLVGDINLDYYRRACCAFVLSSLQIL